MSIIKITVRTGILLVCGTIQVIGVLVEGVSKLLNQVGQYLCVLDNKLTKGFKPKKKKTEEVPT